jgi:hypothetical protein
MIKYIVEGKDKESRKIVPQMYVEELYLKPKSP